MDYNYEAEIVQHLLLISILNLAEFKDFEENDDFCRFFLNSLLVGSLKGRY